MIIEKLNIKSFGRFTNRQIELYPGLNILYGPNESGKTTVHTFIKGMFFGIQKLRGRGAKNDAYHRFEPWNNPGYYAGALYFESGGRHFRVERNFYRDQVSAKLVCMDDGELLDIEKGDLSMLLGDVSEVVYDNTVSIGQLRSTTDQEMVAELRNYMANYQGSGDVSLDLTGTIENLRIRKKEKQDQLQALDDRRQQQMRNLQNNISFLDREIDEINIKIQKHEEILRRAHEDINKLNPNEVKKVINTFSNPEAETKRPNYPAIILAMLLVLSISAGIVFLLPTAMKWAKILVGVVGTILELIILGYLLHRLPDKPQIQEELEEEDEAGQSQEEILRKTLEKAQWSLESLRETKLEKQIRMENLQNDYQEYREQDYSEHPIEKDIRAIDLAQETILDFSNKMQKRLGEKLKVRTSQILGEITRGKYQQVTMDESLQMWVNTSEQHTSLAMMSRGTIEQVYFSLRMAISDILCSEEPLPVILDDVFAMYDDARVQETLTWLAENRRQVIICTCHKREQRILDQMGLKYHSILLQEKREK